MTGGVLGIVLPATILADQASATMRRSALRRTRLVDIAAYPSEARLFARTDQPVVAATFIAEAREGLGATVRLFNADRSLKARRALTMSGVALAAQQYSLSVGFGAEASDLLTILSQLPRFSDLEGSNSNSLWAGRELDETRIQAKIQSGMRYPFIKGRMVRRHQVVAIPEGSVRSVLAEKFYSIAFERVVWRDVARASQKRRMIGAIIPAGWVAGNSLHVAHFRNGSPEQLRALHAVLSSFVMEFQVRSRLSTGHMSLGAVRVAHVPDMSRSVVRTLAVEAQAALMAGKEAAPSLEVAVARAYGLGRDAMAAIVDQFPKVDGAERAAVLDSALWRVRRGR